MSLVVLLILAVVWAVFLVPQVVRARAEKTPADSIGAFRNQLSVLERTTPPIGGRRTPSMGAMGLPRASSYQRSVARATREQVRRRRLAIMVRLLGAMAVTLVLSLVIGPMLYVHVFVDLLFVAYCGLLARARSLATERDVKVRYLPGPAYAGQPTLLLQQSGS